MGIGGSGAIPRVGWGHSTVEDVIEMAAACNVRHALIGHHDPNRDWADRNWIDESMTSRTAGTDRRVELARAETVFDLQPDARLVFRIRPRPSNPAPSSRLRRR